MTKIANYIRWQDSTITVPVERIQRCEAMGYDAVFMGEGLGFNVFSILGYVAALTEKVTLGTAIAHIPARSPVAMAAGAQSLQQLVGPERNIILGMGTSYPWAAEGFYGSCAAKPAKRIREYAGAVRKAFSGDPIDYQSDFYSIPYTGEGAMGAAPLACAITPNPNIPLYIAAGGPLMIRTVGEHFDGWFPKLGTYNPSSKQHYEKKLQEGVDRAGGGKTLDDVGAWVHLDCLVDNDVANAIADTKNYIVALWEGFQPHLVIHGYQAEVDEINQRLADGNKKAAAEFVPEQYIEDGWLLGPLDRIKEKARPWFEAGFEGLIVRSGTQKPNANEPENEEVYRVIADVAHSYG